MENKSFVNRSQKMALLTLLFYLLLCLLSYYFAESPYPFFDQKSKVIEFLIVIFLGTLGSLIYFAIKRNGLMVLILSIGFLGVLLSAYLAKQNVNQAYQDCRNHSEKIRQAVIDYKSTFGDYPNSLEQLKFEICGQLYLHKPLLNYKKAKNDFELWYSDSFMLYRGDSFNPMDAKK